MRSCKEAGTGCLPPRCRTGVSAARLQVAHLDPLRIAGPRSAQAAPLVTPCLRDHRHRLESDALVHRPPGSAAYRRPATARAGHRPRRRPGAVPVRRPSRAGESRSAPAGAPSVPGCQDANPARGCRDQQGVPAHLTPAAPRDINHSRCFRYPHNIDRTRAVIRIWRRLSTGLFTARPQVTGCNSGNTAAAVAACNQLILSWRLPGYPLVPALDHGTHA